MMAVAEFTNSNDWYKNLPLPLKNIEMTSNQHEKNIV